MNILHIITDLDRGNTQKQMRMLVLELQKRGVSQQVVCLSGPGFNSAILQEAGIPVLHLNRPFPLLGFVMGLRRGNSVIKNLGPVDILCGWMYKGDLAAHYYQHKLFPDAKLVLNLRDSVSGESFSERLKRKLVRQVGGLSNEADLVVYSSPRARQRHEHQGYKPQGLVIPNGFDVNSYDEQRSQRKTLQRRYGFADYKKIFITVADYEDDNDFPTLLQAIQMNLEGRNDLLFVLVGKGVDEHNRLLQATVSSSALENIWFMGDRGDVQQLLLASDYFVYAAKQEIPLNAVGEAMCAGLPCIVTNVGDANILVGPTGEIVPPNNVTMLAAAIEKFEQLDEQQYEQRAKKVSQRVRSLFSVPTIADQYHSQFLALLRQGN